MSGYGIDPFLRKPHVPDYERGIGQAEGHAIAPVRSIPVTAAMREADGRRGALTNPVAVAWRARVLGGRTPEPAAPRSHTVHLVSQQSQLLRSKGQPCSGCRGRVTAHSSGKCYACRKPRASEVAG